MASDTSGLRTIEHALKGEHGDRDSPDPTTRLQIGAYVQLRFVIGLISMLLPVLLILGDGLFVDGELTARGSMSAYYHSSMRDVFVGVLATVGIFLVFYKLWRGLSAENVFSIVAGLAAIGVALFPTKRPNDEAFLTAVQKELGESTVSTIHLLSAIVFIVALALISIGFALRERERAVAIREGDPDRWSSLSWLQQHWDVVHFSAAGIIVVMLLYMGVGKVASVPWDSHAVLIGESVSGTVFGISWFAKGLEALTLYNEDSWFIKLINRLAR